MEQIITWTLQCPHKLYQFIQILLHLMCDNVGVCAHMHYINLLRLL